MINKKCSITLSEWIIWPMCKHIPDGVPNFFYIKRSVKFRNSGQRTCLNDIEDLGESHIRLDLHCDV